MVLGSKESISDSGRLDDAVYCFDGTDKRVITIPKVPERGRSKDKAFSM